MNPGFRALIREPLKRYLAAPRLDEHAAAAVLRAAYATAFMAQVVIAVLVAIVVRLLAAGQTLRPNAVLTWTLVAFAVLEMIVAGVLGNRLGVVKGRRAALSTTLLVATLYGSVAWFMALALATEQRGAALYVLLLLLATGYALGFLAVGRLAKAAAAERVPPASEAA